MTKIKNREGFTIVELLIAIALTGIILAAVYGVYIAFYKTSGSQDLMIEAQQNAKAGIAVIERDLINAGLNSGALSSPVLNDSARQLTSNGYTLSFIYRDPRDNSKRIVVRYALLNNNNALSAASQCDAAPCYLIKSVGGCPTSGGDDCTGTLASPSFSNEKIISNVDNLTFTYYDGAGASITPDALSTSSTNRNNIRLVKVSLTTKTSSKLPTSGQQPTVTVTTEVNLRNMGATGTPSDTTAPGAPTIVQVSDPHVCGRLSVTWDKVADSDVGGYKIYYGQKSGACGESSYTGVVSVPLTSLTEVSGQYTYTIHPANSDGSDALAYSPSTNPTQTTYCIGMKAYDTSGNSSGYSNHAGDTQSASFDTIINPVKLSAATSFTGEDAGDGTSGQNWVKLTWGASNATDLAGYRIYRDTSAFASFPISDAKKIAGETGAANLTSSVTEYTDKDTTLVGCKVYYYAIAAVGCDTTLFQTSYALSSDYGQTYGDGSGSQADSPSGSDTAPPDVVFKNNDGGNPTKPTLGVRAGWKRVAVSLTNPTRGDGPGDIKDFKQTCVYVKEGADYPAYSATVGADGCYPATSGQLVPDSSGIFTQSGAANTFWHDSMTEETPASPSLTNQQTYSYKAVSFDYCSNTSAVTAQGQTNLCDEDDGTPVPTNTKPPAPASASASVCSATVTVSWTPVSSDTAQDSSETNPWDLAGYRLIRSTSADFSSGVTLLTSDAPYWCEGTGCSVTGYTDSSISDSAGEGDSANTTYYYKIASTDCPYEKVDPTSATVLSDISTSYLKSAATSAVRPGKIHRDEKTSAAQDTHMEALTGKNADLYSGYTQTYDSNQFYHNTVTMYFENTSAGTMTITGLTNLEWQNTSACLKKITIGVGGANMPEMDNVTCANPTGAILEGFTDKQIIANDRHVPITFEFTKSDGDVDNSVGMRSDSIKVNLAVRNDSTSTTTCNSYLTEDDVNEFIDVPVGPVVTNVVQDKPSSITTPYEATSGNNPNNNSAGVITVTGGNNVNIKITVNSTTLDQTGNAIDIDSAAIGSESDNVVLYYATAACYHDYTAGCKQAPQYNGANYTAVKMFKRAANTYGLYNSDTIACGTTPSAADATDRRIPAQDNKRIWYFIVVKDTEGNFDRAPEVIDSSIYYTAYTYDQGTFALCDVTPSAPTSLTANAAGDDVTLSWTASTTYTDGGCLSATDNIQYRIYRDGAQIGADQPGINYADNNLANGVYSYYVKAKNACPNWSGESNTAAVCVGASGAATISVSGTDRDGATAGLQIYQGDTYNVEVRDCLAVNGGHAAHQDKINDAASDIGSGVNSFTNTSVTAGGSYNPSVTETGNATAIFNAAIPTTGDVEANKLLVSAIDTIQVWYTFATPVSNCDPAVNNTLCIGVISSPCTNTPNAPTGLGLAIDGANDSSRANNTSILISFTAPQNNTDASELTDLDHYKLEVTKIEDGVTTTSTATIYLTSCTSSSANPAAGTTCQYSYSDGDKMKDAQYTFQVKAVDSCPSGGVESAASGSKTETCTGTSAGSCPSSY